MDTIYVHPLKESRTVVVICANRFYEVCIVTADGRVADVRTLHAALASIWRDATATTAGGGGGAAAASLAPPVGVLTADNRTAWATARELLVQLGDRNRETLAAIERALVVVTLSGAKPVGDTEMARALHTGNGNGHDRWWDKAISFVLFANGRLGVNGEHGPTDAPTPGILVDFCCDYERTEEATRTLETLRADVRAAPWAVRVSAAAADTKLVRPLEVRCW